MLLITFGEGELKILLAKSRTKFIRIDFMKNWLRMLFSCCSDHILLTGLQWLDDWSDEEYFGDNSVRMQTNSESKTRDAAMRNEKVENILTITLRRLAGFFSLQHFSMTFCGHIIR